MYVIHGISILPCMYNSWNRFVVENSESCFQAGQREAVCEIKTNEDSLAEGEEDFTVIIVPKDGQCVCNKSLTCKMSSVCV